MSTVKRFEELVIWQEAREQCREISLLSKHTELAKDYALRDQITRASGSVMDNIAEGFDRFTRKDFRHFLIMARGSNAEVRSQLYRIGDKAYINEAKTKELIETSTILSVRITNLINHISRSDYNNKPQLKDQPFVSDDEFLYKQDYFEISADINT